MADQFDPYHRWLGIPPKHQPPDHYRLLGLERFEDDPEVIVDAAERQMTHVRRYALGPHQMLSQQILNELAAAQSCLLDSVEKARYDADLRQRQTAATLPAAPLPPASAPTRVKIRNAASVRPSVPKPAPAIRAVADWLDERLVAWAGPRFPVPLAVLRGLAIGVPLGLAVVGLVLAFGLSTPPPPEGSDADGSDLVVVAPPVEPVPPEDFAVDPAPEPTIEPVPPLPADTRPPRILAIPDQVIEEGVPFEVRVDVDSEEPLDGLRFHLEPGFPAGVVFDEPRRMIFWTPEESQGPGEYSITVVATVSGTDSQELGESFRIGVREVNSAPAIEPISEQVIEPGKELTVGIEVRDADKPANDLMLDLLEGPPSAVIDSAERLFRWTADDSQAGREWPVTLAVRDNGQPPLETVASFAIRVSAPPKPPSPPLAVAPFDAVQAQSHQAAWSQHLGQPVELTNSIGMKLVLIPPGKFLMGSPDDEADRDDDETQHHVRISKPYYMGVYEVTQGEYEQVMGTNPSWFPRTRQGSTRASGQDTSRFPVEQVSWEDAVEFCRRLSASLPEQSSGHVYRLPTEAEWAYACRAGTTTPFHFGAELTGREANWSGRAITSKGINFKRPTIVGLFSLNSFGLYDMHGNVSEWCSDWYGDYSATSLDDPQGPTAGSDRVIRGGCWIDGAGDCRSAYRNGHAPGLRYDFLGFRVACSSVDASGP